MTAAVLHALTSHVPKRAVVAVGLSGGRDSVALLDATLACAPSREIEVVAIHVHHGLSARADDWVRFCDALCTARGVRLLVERVDVPRSPRKSVESEARRVRYAALSQTVARVGANALLLAHHQDDQAETVLLQLLRGAGPQGLAAMPPMRLYPAGWIMIRPLLDVPRAAIDAYVRGRNLAWIDDDSNDDSRFARNALRARVAPALRAMSPGYPATVGRAAQHQAEAALLADDLARHDGRDAFDGVTLSQRALAELPAYRARNLLRWFVRERGLPAPSSARLAAMHEQLCNARADAHVSLLHSGAEIGVHRGRIVAHRPSPTSFEQSWSGEAAITLPHGTLRFDRCAGRGVAAALLPSARFTIRSRRGGERIQLAHNRPRQALKSLLQSAAIPPWARSGLPLLFCDDELAGVPAIGVDIRFAAARGQEGYELSWDES